MTTHDLKEIEEIYIKKQCNCDQCIADTFLATKLNELIAQQSAIIRYLKEHEER